MSWTTPYYLNAVGRTDFPLGMGTPLWPGLGTTPPTGMVNAGTDIILAQKANINAFSIDMMSNNLASQSAVMGSYLTAADQMYALTGQRFSVAPCLDNLGSMNPTNIVAPLAAMVNTYGGSASWPKVNGRYVFWVYTGTSWTAAQWSSIINALSAQGIQAMFILDDLNIDQRINAKTSSVSEVDGYAALPLAFYSFRPDCYTSISASIRSYLGTSWPNSVAAQLSVGTIFPGYWKQGSFYIDAQGTGLIRSTYSKAKASKWLNVTTWDDDWECTHFQPSLAYGYGRLDVLKSLTNNWLGKAYWNGASETYITQPSESFVGGKINGEILSLQADGSPSKTVQVTMYNPLGQAIGSSPVYTLAGTGPSTAAFSLNLSGLAAGQNYVTLQANVTANGTSFTSPMSPPIAVWPGDNPYRTRRDNMWMAELARPTVPAATLNYDAGSYVSKMTAGAAPLNGYAYFRRNSQMLNLQPDPGGFVHDMNGTYYTNLNADQQFKPISQNLRWGFFSMASADANGNVACGAPMWVAPPGKDSTIISQYDLNAVSGTSVPDTTAFNQNASLIGKAVIQTVNGVKVVSTDGTGGYLSPAYKVLPPSQFTVRFTMTPRIVFGSNQTVMDDLSGAIIVRITTTGTLLMQRYNGVTGVWQTAQSAQKLTSNVAYNIAVVLNNGSLDLYVNGARWCGFTGAVNVESTNMRVGVSYNGTTQNFRIDGVAVAPANLGMMQAP